MKSRRLLGRGFWSLADQGIVSAGNFFTNVFLVRGESRLDYGAFAILFGVMLLLNNVHAALVTYAISVKGGASDDSRKVRKLVGNGMMMSLLLAVPLSIPMMVACYAVGRVNLIPFALLSLVLWQLQETTRRGLMAQLRFKHVTIGDAISFLGQAAIIFAISHRGGLTLTHIFLGMSLTSFMALCLQVVQLGYVQLHLRELWGTVVEGWLLGRWLLFNNLLSVMNIQAISWVTAASHGIAEAAELQAVANILGMTHPVLIGISSLIVPATARLNAERGIGRAMRGAATYAAFGAALLVPLYLVLFSIPEPVLQLFYKGKYNDSVVLLRMMALIYSIDFFGTMLSAMLNGLQQNRPVFLASLATLSVSLLVTIPLTMKFGAFGAVCGSVLSVSARVLAASIFVRRIYRLSFAQGFPIEVGLQTS